MDGARVPRGRPLHHAVGRVGLRRPPVGDHHDGADALPLQDQPRGARLRTLGRPPGGPPAVPRPPPRPHAQLLVLQPRGAANLRRVSGTHQGTARLPRRAQQHSHVLHEDTKRRDQRRLEGLVGQESGHDDPDGGRAVVLVVDLAAAIDVKRGVARLLPAALARGAAEETERRQQYLELGGEQFQRPDCQQPDGRVEHPVAPHVRVRDAGAAAARPVPLRVGEVPESHDEPRVSRGEGPHAVATVAVGGDKRRLCRYQRRVFTQ